MNVRNNIQITARVVDKGVVSADLDYQRTWKPLDPDGVNWQRGSMDIKWKTVPC